VPCAVLLSFSMSCLKLNGVAVKDAYDVSLSVLNVAIFLKDTVISCSLKAKLLIMVIVVASRFIGNALAFR